MAIGLSLWAGRRYQLNKMTLAELLVAYFTHHSILTYLALTAAGIALAVALATSPWPPLLAALVIVLVYPLVEYLMHRYVLHARFLYRHKATAALWKRIHFDHHQDPHELAVLFGRALHPPAAIVVIATCRSAGLSAV